MFSYSTSCSVSRALATTPLIGRGPSGCFTSADEVLHHRLSQDARRKIRQRRNQAEYMYLGWWWWLGGLGGGQERLWCLAIFRFPFFTGQQQLKPDKLVHKHTPGHMNASNHAHTDFTLTWNSVVLRMWRPSGLHREESSPIEPSSILQCQSGCSRDHTCKAKKKKKKTERRLDFWQKTYFSSRDHERLALDTASEVNVVYTDLLEWCSLKQRMHWSGNKTLNAKKENKIKLEKDRKIHKVWKIVTCH